MWRVRARGPGSDVAGGWEVGPGDGSKVQGPPCRTLPGIVSVPLYPARGPGSDVAGGWEVGPGDGSRVQGPPCGTLPGIVSVPVYPDDSCHRFELSSCKAR